MTSGSSGSGDGAEGPEKARQTRLSVAGGWLVPPLAAQHRNHVWSYDFVEDRTYDGRRYRMLNVIDEFTHECLAIRVARRLKAIDVIDLLSDLFVLRGPPIAIKPDSYVNHAKRSSLLLGIEPM
jgi:putative transposase